MAECNECKSFFPMEDDVSMGDCVRRVVDPRQAYYQAKPVEADKDAAVCASYQKK